MDTTQCSPVHTVRAPRSFGFAFTIPRVITTALPTSQKHLRFIPRGNNPADVREPLEKVGCSSDLYPMREALPQVVRLQHFLLRPCDLN